MASINPAKFRHFCRVLEKVGEAEDFAADLGQRWKSLLGHWFSIEPAGASENVSGDQVHELATHRLQCRYLPQLVEPGRELLVICAPEGSERKLFVQSAKDIDGTRQFCELLCVERKS